jgi:hypothetical protein
VKGVPYLYLLPRQISVLERDEISLFPDLDKPEPKEKIIQNAKFKVQNAIPKAFGIKINTLEINNYERILL